MPRFSQASNNRLLTCDQRLVQIFEEVISIHDCTILWGARTKIEQDECFRTGSSKVQWPYSKHNVADALPLSQSPTDEECTIINYLPELSMAIDAVPYPIAWKNTKRFYFFAGIVLGVAGHFDVPIRWGGDWDSDRDLDDQTFMDLGHFEIGEY
jgi:peptidoglycan L-alanyl-D-glutamate endopeptidase CwlK